jgi:hypothetical protein
VSVRPHAVVTLLRISLSHSLGQDSSVCIATNYLLDGRGFGVRFPTGARDNSLLHHVQTSEASYQMGTGNLSPGIKRPGLEANSHMHLFPRMRMLGSISPPYVFVVWCLIKHKKKFTLTFTFTGFIFADVANTVCSDVYITIIT